MYKLVIISINSPIIIGIYANNKKYNKYLLSYMISVEGKVSLVMPLLFNFILQKININNEIYLYDKILESNVQNNNELCVLKECGIDDSIIKEFHLSKHLLDKVDTNSIDNYTYIKKISFTLKEAIQFLANFKNIESIYYARGVGSLSSIKLTHVFLHTISLSLNIPIYATNSFYFTDNKEIKAFANMSFFLKQDSKIIKDSTNNNIELSKSINPTKHFVLPNVLVEEDFCESCIPLYVTPAIQ